MTDDTRLALTGGMATLLAALPLTTVTATNSWTVPAVSAVALVVGVGMLARRYRLPTMLIPLAQLVVLTLWLGVLVAGDVARFGLLPTVEWARRLVGVAVEGWEIIETYAAPVPVQRGVLLALVGGVGLVAVAVDLIAVSLRQVVWAGVPLATVYAVPAAVVPGGMAALWFVPVAAGYLALLVAEGRYRVAAWGRSVGTTAQRSGGVPQTDSLARNGRRVGAVAIAAALVVPALLPGLSEGVLGRGGGGGEGGRTIRTDNPIVDLKRDLTRPDNVAVLRFRTDADPPEYIRSVTLDVFDGTVWQTSDRRVPESQRVSEGMPPPPGLGDSADQGQVHYDMEVSENYGSRWLPLPYPARTIDIDGDWRYVLDTLDVVSPNDDTKNVSYAVDSLHLQPTAEQMQSAPTPPDGVEAQLELPDGLPVEVVDLAEEVTADATSDFGRAAALQAFFRRDGKFVYDLDVQPGNSATALLDFLTERRGYCEQFAASMAIMARAVGIPARVAVGFLPGTPQDDGTYVVRAHDAHAWPELYFQGSGWIRFEPTPGSRTGGVPTWTVPPEDAEGAAGGPAPVPTGAAGSPGAANPRQVEGNLSDIDESFGQGAEDRSVWPYVLAGIGVLGVLALPAATAWTRRGVRWRRATGDPEREAEAAWADLRDAARDAGLSWESAATPRTTGRYVARSARLDDDENALLDHVVSTTERARYARTATDVPGLRADSDMLRRSVMRSGPRWRRLRARLWPAATGDLVSVSADRVADGLDWLDSAGERVRDRVGAVVRRS